MPVIEILVVDDDPIGGSLTTTLLQEAGYDAQLVSDSQAVIAAVKAERPGLVILDILMPGIDGLTLCHSIKQDPELQDTKVIVVSGKAFAEDKEKALRFGASLFIEKPYSLETFSRGIRDVIGAPKTAASAAAPRQTLQGVQVRV